MEVFDDIWEKVYSAEQQNQKEKFEIDLKKEIKKLQRLRDQIKSWIGSSDVKDKDNLIGTRKLIETKMEQFKICEKETKTKTYSKEGLARAERLSPEEQAKIETCEWLGDVVKSLGECVDDRDVEIERLSSGKGKKTNKNMIEEYNEYIKSHKFHINKLEGIMRLVMNDILDHELVDDMREDLEYYVDSHDDEDYMQSYDEEFFYESLGLDELDVVNVDRVTQAGTASKTGSNIDDESAITNNSKESKKSKKSNANTSMIPLTIGRARVKKEQADKDAEDDKSHDSSTPTKKSAPTPTVTGPSPSAPAPRPPPAPNANAGASMAAILKRESEQEKERQKQAALQQAQQQVSLNNNLNMIVAMK